MADPIEVRAMPLMSRVFAVGIWIACAAFCYWMAYTQVSKDPWIAYALGALCFYVALYWMRAPNLLVRTDDAGMTYADTRLGMFLVFGEGRAAWTDILGVDTRQESNRSGTYLRTRVTVRGEAGQGKRRFTVTSRAAGYVPFLEALHAHTGGTAAAMLGLGDDPARAQAALRGIASMRIKMVVLVLVLMGAVFGFLMVMKRG
jgi:hypothetical protein